MKIIIPHCKQFLIILKDLFNIDIGSTFFIISYTILYKIILNNSIWSYISILHVNAFAFLNGRRLFLCRTGCRRRALRSLAGNRSLSSCHQFPDTSVGLWEGMGECSKDGSSALSGFSFQFSSAQLPRCGQERKRDNVELSLIKMSSLVGKLGAICWPLRVKRLRMRDFFFTLNITLGI